MRKDETQSNLDNKNQAKRLAERMDFAPREVACHENGNRVLVPRSFIRQEAQEAEERERGLCSTVFSDEWDDVTNPNTLGEFRSLRDGLLKRKPPQAFTTPEASTIPRRKVSRFIPIFNASAIDSAGVKAKYGDKDARERFKVELEVARKHQGLREVPAFKNINKVMHQLVVQFPNFADAVDGMAQDLALAGAGRAADFSVSPILLNGTPGIGKTHFAQSIAAAMKLPFLKISAGGLQHAGQITGTAAHWGNSRSGQIFDVLANNQSAVAVVLIDEVDKLNTRSDHSVLPCLLDLLESETSRRFKDESLGLEMDASRLIILMTSNSLTEVDSALLSRSYVHEVAAPSETQRYAIALRLHQQLCKRTRKNLTMDSTALARLMSEITDLRMMTRAVRSAFACALLNHSQQVIPVVTHQTQKRPIGF